MGRVGGGWDGVARGSEQADVSDWVGSDSLSARSPCASHSGAVAGATVLGCGTNNVEPLCGWGYRARPLEQRGHCSSLVLSAVCGG